MLRKVLCLSSLALLLASCNSIVSSGDEAVSLPQPDEVQSSFTLEYEKFTLDNGLQVVLQVDRSDPIVAVTTVIHAGSSREKPGRTGFAHFFEHMAFNDSENVPRGWNRKAIPDWGGLRNGGTWSDGTIYYEVVPKDAFDKILWIDSDRLGYMINTVTQAALDREKQVVKNEKRQRVDNAAYGYTQEVIRKNLYPKGHPYSWTVIGALPDLQAATLADLKEFYTEVYGPNNVTLAIVGDIDIAQTKAKVKQWFGEIRRGPDVPVLAPMPANLAETSRLYFEDNFAKLPELRITFPTIEAGHTDEMALNVLAAILAGSKNSVLHRQIVGIEKLAPGVSSFHNAMELAGEFVFRVRANAGTDLDAVAAALDTALANFARDGVDSKDLQRIKAEQETSLYQRLSTVLGKANQMASDNEFTGNPAYALIVAQQIEAVSASDVQQVYQKYIQGKPNITTSFVPKGKAGLAIAGSTLASVWIEEVKSDVASEQVSQGEQAVFQKTPSKHDRSEPPFGDLPLTKMPEIWEASLVNNVQLLGIETSEIPLVSFSITFDGGGSRDPLAKKGVANLLAGLMNEGSKHKTAAEMEQAIGLLGSSIRVISGAEEITINVTSLARNFEASVKLVGQILSQPRWQQAEFDQIKSAALTAIKGREANPNGIAALGFRKLLYGDQHPSGWANSGSIKTVSTIRLSDLQTYYQQMLGAKARFHIVGDVSPKRAQMALQSIAKIVKPATSGAAKPETPQQGNAGKVFFIDVPGSKQSVIYVGKLVLASTDADANKLNFTNEQLGGGISGDLAQTLRIEKGYTYGAYSRISSGKAIEPFSASTSVRANATQASLEIIREMIGQYGSDFSEKDVATTQQKLVKQNARAFESLRAKLGILRSISKYGKSHQYVEETQQELMQMRRDDFAQIAKTYLDETEMLYLIVGDKATQFAPVNEFADGKLIELDIYANPLPK